jgi:microtubule-associated protein-like 6
MKVNTSHNNDIICLAYNGNKNIVVSGEMGRKPAIVVWDANTAENIGILPSKLEKNISNVAISKSGRFVAATSMADTHEIAVFDISNLGNNANSKSTMIAYGQGPKSVIHAIKFTNN